MASDFSYLYLDLVSHGLTEVLDEERRKIYNIAPDGRKEDKEENKDMKEMEDRQRVEQGKKYAKKEKKDTKKTFSLIKLLFGLILSNKNNKKDKSVRLSGLLNRSEFNDNNYSNNMSMCQQNNIDQDEPELVLPMVDGQN